MLSEAEVVLWLKRGLLEGGIRGCAAREIVVDADGSYLRSPFRRQLEPVGTIRIGDWRPDLVCVMERAGTEYLAGFEVKATSDHEKGIVQASRYRLGVHEAYLCIPRSSGQHDWLRQAAASNGVGLVRAGADRLELDVDPAPPRPNPKLYIITRRYLLGETGARSLGLNKPLPYVTVRIGYAFE